MSPTLNSDLHLNNAGCSNTSTKEPHLSYRGYSWKAPDTFVEVSPELAEEPVSKAGLGATGLTLRPSRVRALCNDRVQIRELYMPIIRWKVP